MTHPPLTINLADGRKSVIQIGSGLLKDEATWQSVSDVQRVAIITNETVNHLYGDSVCRVLSAKPDIIRIGDGEQFKTLDTFGQVIDEMLSLGHGRTSLVIALGGGVVGDLAGFVAATFQRGIRLVQIPTTLLAQVDSAVGGKTAVNHSYGKNMIGAFYQPELVVVDTETLSTLPNKVYIEGLAEVVKYGIIHDDEFFLWLEQNAEALLGRDQEALAYAVNKSCETKAAFVVEDERESGNRALLNFGHTFGHGLENAAEYGNLLHGEAVAIGMRLASHLSVQLGLCSTKDLDRITSLLQRLELPIDIPKKLSTTTIKAAMRHDKKSVNGQQRFIVIEEIGKALVTQDIDPRIVDETLQTGRA